MGVAVAATIVGCLLSAVSPAKASDLTFTTIDEPGASNTYLYGINDAGQIVGNATNSTGGFLYSNGSFIQLPFPAGDAFGINNSGQIVGGPGSGYQGYLYSGGKLTSFNPGVCNSSTYAYAINDTGQIVGSCQVGSPFRGFLYSGNSGAAVVDSEWYSTKH